MIRSFVFGILVGGVLSAVVLASISYVAPRQNVVTPAIAPATEPAAEGTVAPVAPVTPVEPATTPVAPVPGDAPAGAITPSAPATNEAPATGTPPPKTDAAPATPKDATVAPAADTAPGKATPLAPADAALPAARDDSAAAPAPLPDVVADVDGLPEDGAVAALVPPPAVAAPEVRTALAPLAPAPANDMIAAPLPDDVARAADAPGGLAIILPDFQPTLPAQPIAPPKVVTGGAPAPVTLPETEPAPVVIAQLDPVPPLPGNQSKLPQIGSDAPPPVMDAPLPPLVPKPRILTQETPPEDPGTDTLPPEPPLSGTVEGVVTGRLAQIGAATPTAPAADGSVAQTPLVLFARTFENPDGKPVFSIVLIDTGAADLDRKALAELPFPVSFALDPLDPATPSHVAIYRAAGQEVLMLANGIPEGATASDLEVSFAALAEKMPEAIAVLDQPEPVFQDDRPLATQVVPILAAQGRGLVTWDEGLNAADQVARREGLPTATAFRYLDGEGENTETVRRYLDRAAFRAAQDGRVVVIGQTRPETVEALIAWGLEGRSSAVALAPISAALVVN